MTTCTVCGCRYTHERCPWCHDLCATSQCEEDRSFPPPAFDEVRCNKWRTFHFPGGTMQLRCVGSWDHLHWHVWTCKHGYSLAQEEPCWYAQLEALKQRVEAPTMVH